VIRPETEKYAVIITCYNRREMSLRCLNQLFTSKVAENLEVYLLDDGSVDGTADAIEAQFPSVHLFRGDGSYYWSGGVRMLWDHCKSPRFTGYIWLNDDNLLDEDAFERLLVWARRTDWSSIIGGAMRDPVSGGTSYGGGLRTTFHPMHFENVDPDPTQPLEVDVLNGNMLLIPQPIADVVGGVGKGLVQNGADFEYCVRARRHGFKSLLLPATFGACAENDWGPKKRGIQGLRKMLKPRHLPFGPTMWFFKSMAGPTWPIWYVISYVKAFLTGY
jgi:GT2 family glycosyltransferase